MKLKAKILDLVVRWPHVVTDLVLAFFSCSEKLENSAPNVVIIYADNMGYGDLNIQNSDSSSGPAGIRRDAFYQCPQFLRDLFSEPLCLADGNVSLETAKMDKLISENKAKGYLIKDE
ncbi:hypothetical protein [Cyclobacterium salsum]